MVAVLMATSVVIAVIISGAILPGMSREKALKIFKGIFGSSVAVIALAIILTMIPSTSFAETVQTGKEVNGNAMIGVALSTGLAALGAGIAVGMTGAAAIGAISEDPKMLGRSLIFVGLAEGIAIYGLVISIMIFGRV
jgi:V/A-type H+-transporting ATPase subunit K